MDDEELLEDGDEEEETRVLGGGGFTAEQLAAAEARLQAETVSWISLHRASSLAAAPCASNPAQRLCSCRQQLPTVCRRRSVCWSAGSARRGRRGGGSPAGVRAAAVRDAAGGAAGACVCAAAAGPPPHRGRHQCRRNLAHHPRCSCRLLYCLIVGLLPRAVGDHSS